MTAFWNVSFPNFKLEQYVLLRHTGTKLLDTRAPLCSVLSSLRFRGTGSDLTPKVEQGQKKDLEQYSNTPRPSVGCFRSDSYLGRYGQHSWRKRQWLQESGKDRAICQDQHQILGNGSGASKVKTPTGIAPVRGFLDRP